MGHDFLKGKDVGEFVQLWPKRGKTPCVLFPCFYFQPLSLKNYCWWLKQLMILGAGVAGLSVLTHTHTLPTILVVHLLTQTFIFTPRVVEHPRTAKSHPSCCVCIHGQKRSCFSSRRASIVCSFPHWVGLLPHAQEFS